MVLSIHTDGSCHNSKGSLSKTGLGAYFQLDKEVIDEFNFGIPGPDGTNNTAEWDAFQHALYLLLQYPHYLEGVKEIHSFSDSQIMVRQFNGEYEVKEPNLKTRYLECKRLSTRLQHIVPIFKLSWIPREENTEADKLSKIGRESTTPHYPSIQLL